MDGIEFDRHVEAIVGAERYLRAAADAAPYLDDWRGQLRGEARGVALPASVAEVSALVAACRAAGIAVVPQSGNTGLTGGAVPLDRERAIVINLSRLNRVREVDLGNNSITLEAGCILETVRAIARDNGRVLPIDLGSAGSCMVGGLVSTNAGGTEVLRYGNMRELVLGLEVVLPSGEVWSGLRALRKDNSGYDLKQLFIGAEGTLGIVTAAVLKLHPAIVASVTAMVGLGSVADAVALLHELRSALGNRVEKFELMSRGQLELVLTHGDGRAAPLPIEHPWFVLFEVGDTAPGSDLAGALEDVLAAAMESGRVANAVIATDLAKAQRIWALRHAISEANKREGYAVSNDTSVPMSRIADFLQRVEERVAAELPTAKLVLCGHVGDGNVHVIMIFPHASDGDLHLAERANEIAHVEALVCNGSISAEHGIGLSHVGRLASTKPAVDLAMMRRIKDAFDPDGIMNPGKVLA